MTTAVPETYSDALADITQIAEDMRNAKARIIRGMQVIEEGVDIFDNLNEAAPVGYAGTISYINAQAAANPDDAEWHALKGRVDKVVADFQAELARSQAILAAAQRQLKTIQRRDNGRSGRNS